ncbi:uncharacterized protein AMSG_12266 [Thecamonas trahens ATCC 50062]|uniref:AAA+ ATPase domain-containing protein n=1 Tax=Thecamonas trahens ATCC 50062 TaxID=461836 RepID=A0A0L0DP32_THETB|nr:hypothetical protein AMSG_12266 [Thecamonas trahens ATCC 50062]KNC53786.1 hypothetical protein AMSG_12266 [Thecamonas trahens ATCC 50062]|eukprot:XP_013754379.1 hypothetical protein AMSG_12266 [Thecamonas trahens ATCC 50062]
MADKQNTVFAADNGGELGSPGPAAAGAGAPGGEGEAADGVAAEVRNNKAKSLKSKSKSKAKGKGKVKAKAKSRKSKSKRKRKSKSKSKRKSKGKDGAHTSGNDNNHDNDNNHEAVTIDDDDNKPKDKPREPKGEGKGKSRESATLGTSLAVPDRHRRHRRTKRKGKRRVRKSKADKIDKVEEKAAEASSSSSGLADPVAPPPRVRPLPEPTPAELVLESSSEDRPDPYIGADAENEFIDTALVYRSRAARPSQPRPASPVVQPASVTLEFAEEFANEAEAGALLPHVLEVDALAEALQTSCKIGLSAEDHEARLDELGHHWRSPPPAMAQFQSPRESIVATLVTLARELIFKHESRMALWLAVVLTFAKAIRDSDVTAGAACMLLLLAAFVQLVMALEFQDTWARLRWETARAWFGWSYGYTHTVAIRAGGRAHTLVQDLVPGDLIEVSAPGVVPADIRIVTDSGKLVVDSSARSEPSQLSRRPAAAPNTHRAYARAPNMAFAGETMVTGYALGLVVAVGADSLYYGDPSRASSLVLDPLDDDEMGETRMAASTKPDLEGTHLVRSGGVALLSTTFSASLVHAFRIPLRAFSTLTLAEAQLGGRFMLAGALLAATSYLLAGITEGLDPLTVISITAVYLWLVLPDRMRVQLRALEAERVLAGERPRRLATALTLSASDKLVETTQIVISPAQLIDGVPHAVSTILFPTDDEPLDRTTMTERSWQASLRRRKYDGLLRAVALTTTKAFVDTLYGDEDTIRANEPVSRALLALAHDALDVRGCKAQHPCMGRIVFGRAPKAATASGLVPVATAAAHSLASSFVVSIHPLAEDAHIVVGVAPLRMLLTANVATTCLVAAGGPKAAEYVETLTPLGLSAQLKLKTTVRTMEAAGQVVMAYVHKRLLLPENVSGREYARQLVSSPSAFLDEWTADFTLVGLVGVPLKANPEVGRLVTQLQTSGVTTHLFSPYAPQTTLALAQSAGIVLRKTSLDSLVPPFINAAAPAGAGFELGKSMVVPSVDAHTLAAGLAYLTDVAAQSTAVLIGRADDWMGGALDEAHAQVGIYTLSNRLLTLCAANGPSHVKHATFCDMYLADASLETLATVLARARGAVDTEIKAVAGRTAMYLAYTMALALGFWFALPLPFTASLLVLAELVVRLHTIVFPRLVKKPFVEPDVMLTDKTRSVTPSMGKLLRFGRLFSGPLVLYASLLAGLVVLGALSNYAAVMNTVTSSLAGQANAWESGAPIAGAGNVLCEARSAFYLGLVVGFFALLTTTLTRSASLIDLPRRTLAIHASLIVVQMVLLVLSLEVSPFQVFFGTCAVAFRGWLPSLLFAAVIIALDELRKYLLRYVVVDPNESPLRHLYFNVRDPLSPPSPIPSRTLPKRGRQKGDDADLLRRSSKRLKTLSARASHRVMVDENGEVGEAGEAFAAAGFVPVGRRSGEEASKASNDDEDGVGDDDRCSRLTGDARTKAGALAPAAASAAATGLAQQSAGLAGVSNLLCTSPQLKRAMSSLRVVDVFRAASAALSVGACEAADASSSGPAGREVEAEVISRFWRSRLANQSSGSMYVSGAPGTGKSFTFTSLPAQVHAAKQTDPSLPAVVTVHLNCMSHITPSTAYTTLLALLASQLERMGVVLEEIVPEAADVRLLRSLSAGDHAQRVLSKLFSVTSIPPLRRSAQRQRVAAAAVAAHSSSAAVSESVCEASFAKGDSALSFIIVLDEMDQLGSNGNAILYQMFEWAGGAGSLVLFGVANALDLTDRMLPQLRRLGKPPATLEFRPYTAGQLESILEARLATVESSSGSQGKIFQAKALRLLARRVQNHTGDVRMALNLCRGVLDALIASRSPALNEPAAAFRGLSIGAMSKHIRATLGSKQGSAIANLTLHQKVLLLAGACHVARSGKSYLTYVQLENAYRRLCTDIAHFSDFATGSAFFELTDSLQTLSLVSISSSSGIALSRSASTGSFGTRTASRRLNYVKIIPSAETITTALAALNHSLFDRMLNELKEAGAR